MTVHLPPGPSRAVDVEALVAAARRRQRRRRQLLVALVAVAVAALAAGYFALRGATGGWPISSGAPKRSGPTRSGTAIRLGRPGALALGPSGALYIADDGRNQILERNPNGTFCVVAGKGKAGFSGDGGHATRAELDMPGGMAIGRDETLYFADEGNNRIRVIATDGIISTVAGNGKYGWVRSGTPSRAATILSPGAVTIGPSGRLYIADSGGNEVLRLEPNGTLTRISGSQSYAGIRVRDVGRPAVNESPAVPDALAFGRGGNLYIAGFSVKVLLTITPKGIMARPDGISGFYPRGSGALVTAPNGHVYAANGPTIVRLTPHGIKPVFDFYGRPFDGITGFLPEGIAVAPNGDIYTDTWVGNGWANRTALVMVRPGKKPRVLWKK